MPEGFEGPGDDPGELTGACTKCKTGGPCSLTYIVDGPFVPAATGASQTHKTAPRLQSTPIIGDLVATGPQPLLARAFVGTYPPPSSKEVRGGPQALSQSANERANQRLKKPVLRPIAFSQSHSNRLMQMDG